MRIDDKLWKGILEDFFEQFLCLLYPDARKIFDLSRGFEFLDKELLALFPELEKASSRYADKLVKVWLKDGTEKWILVHAEVQGYIDRNFSERMFTYFYRILDKYNVPIESIAILTDDNPSYMPTEYVYRFMSTELIFRFKTYKIIAQDAKALAQSDNPFAMVVLAVLEYLKNKTKGDDALLEIKLNLVRLLKDKNYSARQIRSILYFIRRYINFSDKEKNTIFEKKFEIIYPPKQKAMGINKMLDDEIEVRGEARGEEKKTIEFVINLYNESFELAKIAKLAAISIERVRDILIKKGLLK